MKKQKQKSPFTITIKQGNKELYKLSGYTYLQVTEDRGITRSRLAGEVITNMEPNGQFRLIIKAGKGCTYDTFQTDSN